MKHVLIVQKTVPHYRVPFFNGLRHSLKTPGVHLHLAYGSSRGADASKNDEVPVDWGSFIKVHLLRLGGVDVLWQNVVPLLRGKDLVIVEQANRLLVNYVILLLRPFYRYKVAFWGHGTNLQSPSTSIGNRFKSILLHRCDWWFAYTAGVKKRLELQGFPAERITVVQNAIDTKVLIDHYKSITDQEVRQLRREHNISSRHIGLYCGGIYKEKRIDFLLEAAILVREHIPDFELVVVGAGPDTAKVLRMSAPHTWIHYIGPKFGTERVPYFKMASLLLLPGLVGLAILDALAMETPMITTDYPYHGPEIEYLEHKRNGLITSNNLSVYAMTIVQTLRSARTMQSLVEGCRESSDRYTMPGMVNNFGTGILKALNG